MQSQNSIGLGQGWEFCNLGRQASKFFFPGNCLKIFFSKYFVFQTKFSKALLKIKFIIFLTQEGASCQCFTVCCGQNIWFIDIFFGCFWSMKRCSEKPKITILNASLKIKQMMSQQQQKYHELLLS